MCLHCKRKDVIKIDFIDDKIIIPMNQFADKHPKLMFWTHFVISTFALIGSIAKQFQCQMISAML